MSFLDVRFPTAISYGAVGGPGYSTDVVTLNSGFESRNQNWSVARCWWDVAKGCETPLKVRELITFFRVAKGRTHSFRFRDSSDYQVISGQGILTQLTATTYQLAKFYNNAAGSETRTITLPVDAVIYQGSPEAALTSGIHYTLSLTTGILTILGSPQITPVSWTGLFDIPARFDTDQIKITHQDLRFFKAQTIPVVEVRV